MKFKLYTDKKYSNPIEQILEGRGIEDIREWLNADMDCVSHWSKLDNMEESVYCVHDVIENNGNVDMIVDCD